MLPRRYTKEIRRCLWLGLTLCVAVTFLMTFDLVPLGQLRSGQRKSAGRQKPAEEQQVTWDEEEVEARMAARILHVSGVCRRHKLGFWSDDQTVPDIKYPPTPQYSVFYFNRPHRLGYCPLYKAGSTSWLYFYTLLGGYTEERIRQSGKQISEISRRLVPELEPDSATKALNDSYVFLVVRHPFERLLSAYRDKLENIRSGLKHGTEHYYRKYGSKIVQKYRTNGRPMEQTSRLLGVLNEVVNRLGPQQPMDEQQEKSVPPLGIEPTFSEFVRYIIDTDLVNYSDDHWIPYYLFCTPCSVRYDAIVKFETLTSDQQYVLREAGLEEKASLMRWRHMTRGRPTRQLAQKYFSTLTYEQAKKLYEKYWFDFELFDYSPDEYYQMTM